ncbi:unnamed protein product [Peronospora belbahrii]|uniref:PPM-type phosphatase domain-containing protein n=1 Tax=Peronospora belbahrii TaxID=622444 RepID=A0AAU9KWD2_9STRA|nr:unnamed protein product [Peronospora belbahrii]
MQQLLFVYNIVKDHEDNIRKAQMELTASLLCEISSSQVLNFSSTQELESVILDYNAPWITAQGIKTLSACGKFVAIEDAGVLSYYKSNETLLFGHEVMHTHDSDSGSDVAGTLLRLGDQRLADFEQKLFENNKDVSSVILSHVQFQNVGQLIENATFCMLIHRFQSQKYMILGIMPHLYGRREESRRLNGIEKVSMCGSRSSPIDAMTFDVNCNLLVVLSDGGSGVT